MNNLGRNIAIWLITGAALMALFNMFQTSETTQSSSKIAYTDFIAQAKSGGITDVLIEGNNLKGRTRENSTVVSYKPDGADVVATLEGSDVRIDARPDESNMPGFLSVLISRATKVVGVEGRPSEGTRKTRRSDPQRANVSAAPLPSTLSL